MMGPVALGLGKGRKRGGDPLQLGLSVAQQGLTPPDTPLRPLRQCPAGESHAQRGSSVATSCSGIVKLQLLIAAWSVGQAGGRDGTGTFSHPQARGATGHREMGP